MWTHCPECQSENIYKSRRKGWLEAVVLKLIHVRAYRCQSCDLRFFRWATHRRPAAPPATTSARSGFPGIVSPLSESQNAASRILR